MTSVSTDDDEKLAPGRIVAAIFFALLALALLVFACIYLIMGAHHTVRGAGILVLALASAIAAWFALRYQSLAREEARAAERAAAEAKGTAAGQASSGQATAGQATEA